MYCSAVHIYDLLHKRKAETVAGYTVIVFGLVEFIKGVCLLLFVHSDPVVRDGKYDSAVSRMKAENDRAARRREFD